MTEVITLPGTERLDRFEVIFKIRGWVGVDHIPVVMSKDHLGTKKPGDTHQFERRGTAVTAVIHSVRPIRENC